MEKIKQYNKNADELDAGPVVNCTAGSGCKTNAEIVKEYYPKIIEFVYNMIKERRPFAEDFIQDISLQLLTMPNDKLNTLYQKDELRPYILGIIRLNLHSVTSQFYYKYVKPAGVDREELPDVVVQEDFSDTCLLDNEDLALLNHYIQTGHNISTLAKELGKSYYQTRKTIKKLKKEFKL